MLSLNVYDDSLWFAGVYRLKNAPARELVTALLASGMTGFGIVALFCVVGVNV
jgi:hypothetical protein